MSQIVSKNPYTQEVNATFDKFTNDQVDAIIQSAHNTYLDRKNTSHTHRKTLFLRLADLIDENNNELATYTTMEMGMLNHISKNILKGTANLIRRYANNVESILGNQRFDHNGLTGEYQYDPLGVIYGIAPWNFPYNQVLRAAVANIIAGNTTVYKHASNVPLCAQKIEELFVEAGFPSGIYTTVFISGSQSEHIIRNPYIQGVNITASEAAGSTIGSLAGKYLKPSVLELGGNDAFVLLDHENTQAMAAQAVACRITMGGQRCNASKRFIVLEKHYDEFVSYMKSHMESLTLGDPMDSSSDIPPIATTKLLDQIHQQVQKTIQEGATLITGGIITGEHGQFYTPTVLADVTPGMTSAREEVFGPVASVIKSSSIQESIHIANSSDFGLSAVVFGDNTQQCIEVAHQLEGGMIFVNNQAGSKASLPFGGVKKSGYGKENGAEGLRAFTNKKAIVYSVD